GSPRTPGTSATCSSRSPADHRRQPRQGGSSVTCVGPHLSASGVLIARLRHVLDGTDRVTLLVRAGEGTGVAPRGLPGAGGWAVAVQDLGLVLVPRRGGSVRSILPSGQDISREIRAASRCQAK